MVRARMEVEIHRSLPSHPNLAPLLAAEETNETIIILTPYAKQGDLWDKIRYGDTLYEAE